MNSFYKIKNVKSRCSGKNNYIYPTKHQRSSKIIFLCLPSSVLRPLSSVFCLLISVLCPPSSFSQTAPGIEWQNTIGGEDWDELRSIQQTTDGGYILSGFSWSNLSGDKTENCIGGFGFADYWIVKTDSVGVVQWDNTIGGNARDVLFSIQQTTDGGYILGGYSESDISADKTENSNGANDYWIVKTDFLGTIQWQNTIGGSSYENLNSIQQTSDGGYILGGTSSSNISGDKTENSIGLDDYWIVKTDSAGNIQWQNTIGGSYFDVLNSIQQTTDGGYILGGYSWSDISGDKTENNWDSTLSTGDFWIVKTDSAGMVQWDNTIGGIDEDEPYSVQQTTDGGYILGGFSRSNISGDKTENNLDTSTSTFHSPDYWIVKINSAGNIQWQNTIGGSWNDLLNSIQQTNDGGYIMGGWSNSNISGDKTENCNGIEDYWIVKTDSLGNIQWQNSIGGSDADELYSMQQTTDNGYILGGLSRSDISGDKTENSKGGSFDYWIIKLFPDTITGISNFKFQISNFQFSPNPLTLQSKLTFNNPNKEKYLFTLYDITGRITQTVSTITNEIILTKGSKQPGVYLFNLMNEKTGESMNDKIIITN